MRKYWYRRFLLVLLVLSVLGYAGYEITKRQEQGRKKEVSADTVSSDTVIPGGMPVGIYLETEGVMVLGTEKITGADGKITEPARHLVKAGDYIVECNGKKIAQSVAECYQYTGEDGESASEKLGRALRTLSEAVDADEQLSQLYTQLADVDNLLNDFNHELAEYQKNCEFSDEEFYETEKRLNEINHLKTKYGNSYEEIMSYCKKQEERIGILENYDTYMQELEKSCEQLSQKYLELAGKLSALRQKKAKMLEKKIQKGLEDLNFEQVQFEIHFAEKKEYAKDGIDDVEFRISLNQGQPVKPLTEVASGGELSRIMLAIKAVMADKDEIETLIFDEIDVGISGRTAQKVSEKMALIGKEHQVICITHLAQIAAMADRHFLIEKKTEDAVTRTQIYPLNEENSVEELARILGGARITDTVMQSAREMKNLASQMK